MIRSLVSYCAHTFVLGRLVLNERGATKKAQAKGGEAEQRKKNERDKSKTVAICPLCSMHVHTEKTWALRRRNTESDRVQSGIAAT